MPEPGTILPPSFALYMADMTSVRLQRLLENAGRMDPEKPEQAAQAVHQMRVWARRTRAALDIVMSQFSVPELARLSTVLKECADALGTVRDIDVMCEKLRSVSAGLTEAERCGIEAIVARLSATREAHLPHLMISVERLKSEETTQLLDVWRTSLTPPTAMEGVATQE